MKNKCVEILQSSCVAIENELNSSDYNKLFCADLIGRLRGAINIAFCLEHISPDDLEEWKYKCEYYTKLNVDRIKN